jgi:Ca2+-transporting ATPase
MQNKNIDLQKRQNTHALSVEEVLNMINTSEAGLEQAEVERRLKDHGKNAVSFGKDESIVLTFLRQFESPLIYVLLGAAVIVTLLGEISDAVIILFVLVLNALVGAFQEGKARKTFNALRDFSKGVAFVLRDKKEVEISDEDVVLGDVIVLRSGDKVPADARIISTQGIKVDESALTGESEPVEKNSETIKEEALVSDRLNMLYKGSLVVFGGAMAVVVGIGKETVIGGISEQISDIDAEMPLKKKIADLSKILGILVLMAAIFIFVVGTWQGVGVREIFFASVAIAVSLIPEGLPVVITLILALGVYKMAKRNALVKNMQAVEALGQATVVAVDKTGTITKNELMIQKIWTDNKEFEVSGQGFDPQGEVSLGGAILEPLNHPELILAARVATLCANASIRYEENSVVKVSGDPTEAAMLVFGEKVGFKQSELLSESPQVFEVPFSYEHKFHTTMHKNGEEFLLTVVGEPESILARTSRVYTSQGEREITSEDRETIYQKMREFSKDGLRIILYAYHKGANSTIDIENLPSLCLAGFYGMSDVLRPQVEEAVLTAASYGVRTVMITGDHLGTAEAIAKKAGIWKEGDISISGAEISKMSEEEFLKALGKVTVFGRVLPEHKMKIIDGFKKRGEIIGMTGDGVNDALSLRAAHLGIAMGQGGTEVAKEAADIVLLDNNFKSIVAAIEEGRRIYGTIKNVVLYLISTGLGEFLTIFGSLLLGWKLPILPSQILWLNLVTDGFLVVALAFESRVSSHRVPRRSSAIFSRHRATRAFIMGIVMMVGTLLVYRFLPVATSEIRTTVALTLLAVFQWFNAWNCRSDFDSAFKKPFSNIYLVFGLLGAVGSHTLAVYHPLLQKVLKTVSLEPILWVYIIIIATSILWIEELRKLVRR